MLAAIGSTMNNKYAEGYPGRRYYGGCEFVDVTEQLAIDRAKELFGADHANVQPHAGAQANMAVFGAFLEPATPTTRCWAWCSPTAGTSRTARRSTSAACGSTSSATRSTARPSSSTWIAIRDLAQGTSARRSSWPATRPTRARSTSPRSVRSPTRSARSCGSTRRHFIGLVAGGAYPSPVPHADVVTFTTHKALRGPRGAMILCREEHAKAIDKAVFPMMQGGPARALHRRQGRGAEGGDARPEFKDYAERTVRDARALAAGLADEGLRIVSGGTDSHLILADLRPLGVDGKTAEARGGRGRDRAQQEPDPLRPEPAVDALGHPRRHAGPVDAGHGRARDAGDREHHGRRAEAPRTTRASRRRRASGCAT